MSVKTMSWILLAAIALGAVLLFNYWASYQWLSMLAYTGIVAAILGLMNLVMPFGFMGIRKRYIGALVLAGGVAVSLAALFWPAAMIRVAQPRTRLDEIVPEYQFGEWHSARVHARPEQVIEAVRQTTFGDMKSLGTLLRIRAAALRIHDSGDSFQGKRVLDAFSASGYVTGGNDHEIVMCGGANVQAQRSLGVRTLQECADYREGGAVKMAYNFAVEDAGGGWSTITTETRVVALDDATCRGMARYWRLIVPGSGLLRRQWLDAIQRRAEGEGQK